MIKKQIKVNLSRPQGEFRIVDFGETIEAVFTHEFLPLLICITKALNSYPSFRGLHN